MYSEKKIIPSQWPLEANQNGVQIWHYTTSDAKTPFFEFDEFGLPLHCYYFQVYSDLEW